MFVLSRYLFSDIRLSHTDDGCQICAIKSFVFLVILIHTESLTGFCSLPRPLPPCLPGTKWTCQTLPGAVSLDRITQLPGSEGTHKLLHCGNVGVGVSTLVKMCLFYLTSWLHSQWVKATVICNTLCLFSLSWRRKKWRRPSNLKSLMSTA